MSERGPSRIVLIDSGGYQYGEFQLDGPIQLVAANNVGKTTMIAGVQFLYIDAFDDMHFAHSKDETKRHYFPRQSSFILFECVTPRGYAVVGVHGRGPVQSFDYERFVYEGAYRREDFCEGRLPRTWDEIRARLADREFRLLEPGDYRRTLLGASVDSGLPLGLVPLVQLSAYDSFRFLFRNLLQLARLNQDKLKALLIEMEGASIRRRVVNVATQFRGLHAQVKREAAEVLDLQHAKASIESLLELRDRLATLRAALRGRWQEIERQHRDGQRRFQEESGAHEQASAELAERERDWQSRRETARVALTEAIKAHTSACDRLAALDERARRLSGFVPEIATGTIGGLDKEITGLDVRLRDLQAFDEKELERGLRRCSKELEQLRTRLAGIDGSVGARLVSQLTAETVGRLFAVLNPDLLAVPAAHVDVTSEDGALARLRELSSRVDGSGYKDESVRIPPEDLPSVDLANYLDADQLRVRVQDLSKEYDRLHRAAADQRERATLVATRDQRSKQREQLRQSLTEWQAWQRDEKERATLGAALDSCRTVEGECRASDLATEREGQQLLAEKSARSATWEERQKAWQRVHRSVLKCTPAPEEWPVAHVDGVGGGLAELVDAYGRQFAEQEQRAADVESKLKEVHLTTSSRHAGIDEAETFKLLREALDAVEEKSHAVDELWRSLVVGLRSEFKGMRDDLDRLERRTRKLTKDLGTRKVSNLTRFAVDFVRDPGWTKQIDTIIDQEERPLFASAAETNAAINRVAKILEDREQIRLEDLFSLAFRIFGPGGAERRFASLDAIESHGTTITIKVLVQLELMHGLLRETEVVRLPFFLDEVSALDDANLDAIVAHARAMGFLPLLASPDPKTAAAVTYYYLSGEAGRLVVEEPARMELRKEEQAAS
jgi:hypothetical protein